MLHNSYFKVLLIILFAINLFYTGIVFAKNNACSLRTCVNFPLVKISAL
jgi:hypothetical protein